jgi:hypothetical protein
MSQTLTETPERGGNIISVPAPTLPEERKGLTKK